MSSSQNQQYLFPLLAPSRGRRKLTAEEKAGLFEGAPPNDAVFEAGCIQATRPPTTQGGGKTLVLTKEWILDCFREYARAYEDQTSDLDEMVSSLLDVENN